MYSPMRCSPCSGNTTKQNRSSFNVFEYAGLVSDSFLEPACTAFIKEEGISEHTANATVYAFRFVT